MQRSIPSALRNEFQEIRAGFQVLGRAIKSWFGRRQPLRTSSLNSNGNAELSRAPGTMGEDAVLSGPAQQIELLGEFSMWTRNALSVARLSSTRKS
jgi:hypothetical protein